MKNRREKYILTKRWLWCQADLEVKTRRMTSGRRAGGIVTCSGGGDQNQGGKNQGDFWN